MDFASVCTRYPGELVGVHAASVCPCHTTLSKFTTTLFYGCECQKRLLVFVSRVANAIGRQRISLGGPCVILSAESGMEQDMLRQISTYGVIIILNHTNDRPIPSPLQTQIHKKIVQQF